MLKLIQTDFENTDFVSLVDLLNADLAERDGSDHAFYSQYNGIDVLKYVVVAYDKDGNALGCGAFKEFNNTTVEVKRMYTLPEGRGKGVATSILKVLEKWAAEIGYSRCVLETGKRQPEAIALYTKNGYKVTSNYGPYIGVANSVCFEKML